jgi:hypothetical protein
MSKRKAMARREASGKIRRPPPLPSPIEVVRLRDAALAGMRDAVWGSTLGWLFLNGKIDAAQFAAGKHWVRLAADYAQAMQAPRAVKSAALEPMGGTPPDPDSEKGRRQAHREVLSVADYEAAFTVLKRCPGPVLMAVQVVCEQGMLPVGAVELLTLRAGLSALVETRMGQRY